MDTTLPISKKGKIAMKIDRNFKNSLPENCQFDAMTDKGRQMADYVNKVMLYGNMHEDDDEQKYGGDKSFKIKKAAFLTKRKTELKKYYKELFSKYKNDLGYHYNEIILAIIYIFKIKKDKELFRIYKNISVSDSDDSIVLTDKERKMMGETTTAASSGAYVTPFAWAKDKNSHTAGKEPMYKGGTKVKHYEAMELKDFLNLEEDKKTDSIKKKDSIGRETEKLTKKDMDALNKKVQDFNEPDEGIKDEDLKKYPIKDEEQEEREEVLRGMEAIDYDRISDETEKRIKDEMDSENTDFKLSDRRERQLKRSREERRNFYKKTDIGKTTNESKIIISMDNPKGGKDYKGFEFDKFFISEKKFENLKPVNFEDLRSTLTESGQKFISENDLYYDKIIDGIVGVQKEKTSLSENKMESFKKFATYNPSDWK